MIFLMLSILLFGYFVALQIASPGTLLGTIFSFSTLVLFGGAVLCAVLFAMRKRRLWRHAKPSVRIAILCVLGAGAMISAVNLYFICHPRLADGTEKCKYVILLGGGITKDAELSDGVRKRVEAAAKYMKAHPDAVAVVSGGQGPFSPCPESDVLKPALCSYGIEEARVLAEDKAKDTIQNFQYSVLLLAETFGVTVQDILNAPVTVVTSDFHLARSERLARRMGFKDMYGTAAPTPPLFVPISYAREICSYIKLNLRILLTGKPKEII